MWKRTSKLVIQCRHYCLATVPVKSEEVLIYRKHGPTVSIILNRPDKRNALNEELVNKLEHAILEFENDEELKAGIIFGEGGNFCAGYDLKELDDSEEYVPQHFIHNKLTEKFVKKPLIAAVTGYAVGAGFDLALWCDLRVVEVSSIMGCLSRRYGMTMSESGIGRLQAMVGLSATMDMLVSAKIIKADKAFEMNIANRIAESGTGVGVALALAESIVRFPQKALLSDRAMLYKMAAAKIGLKHDDAISEQAYVDRDEILKDLKRGAKLFTQGAGRHGVVFSCNLWNSV